MDVFGFRGGEESGHTEFQGAKPGIGVGVARVTKRPYCEHTVTVQDRLLF